MKPCASPVACARSTALIGSVATRAAMPWRFASPSLKPTWASGGSVNMQMWHEPIVRAASTSRQIVADDAKVVLGDVGELRAAGAFAHRPNVRCTRLQPLVDTNVATIVEADAGNFETDPAGIGDAAGGDQDVAALDVRFPGGSCRTVDADLLAGASLHTNDLGRARTWMSSATRTRLTCSARRDPRAR